MRGGRRTRAMDKMTMVLKTMTNPMVRTVHIKPTLGSSCCAMSGKMIPPVAPPDAVIAMASERLVVK